MFGQRTPSSLTLEKTVIARFHDSVYLHDEYEFVDPLRLAAQSVAVN